MNILEEQLTQLADGLRVEMERRLERADFGPKKWTMPRPRVCVMEAKRSRTVLGWYSAHRWKQGAVRLDEIVLTPPSVSQGIYEAVGVLAHELVHLANAVAGRPDTSRNGRYHNALYRATAEAAGLIVTRHPAHGWSQTALGPELRGVVKQFIDTGTLSPHPFKYLRQTNPTAVPSLVKLTAPCGVFAYVTRANADSLLLKCAHCGELLRRSET